MGPHVSVPIQVINANYFIDEKRNAVRNFRNIHEKCEIFFFNKQLTKPEALVKN